MSRAKRGPSRQAGRDTRRIATLDDLVLQPEVFESVFRHRPRPVDVLPDLVPLVDVADGRLFDPDPYASSDVSVGYRAPLLVPSIKAAISRGGPARRADLLQVGARVGYEEPKRVAACIRRKVRKQVLHAKGVAGSSARLFKKRKRGPDSDRSC